MINAKFISFIIVWFFLCRSADKDISLYTALPDEIVDYVLNTTLSDTLKTMNAETNSFVNENYGNLVTIRNKFYKFITDRIYYLRQVDTAFNHFLESPKSAQRIIRTVVVPIIGQLQAKLAIDPDEYSEIREIFEQEFEQEIDFSTITNLECSYFPSVIIAAILDHPLAQDYIGSQLKNTENLYYFYNLTSTFIKYLLIFEATHPPYNNTTLERTYLLRLKNHSSESFIAHATIKRVIINLVKAGMSPNFTIGDSLHNASNPLLLLCIQHGFFDIAKILIKLGADVSITNDFPVNEHITQNIYDLLKEQTLAIKNNIILASDEITRLQPDTPDLINTIYYQKQNLRDNTDLLKEIMEMIDAIAKTNSQFANEQEERTKVTLRSKILLRIINTSEKKLKDLNAMLN